MNVRKVSRKASQAGADLAAFRMVKMTPEDRRRVASIASRAAAEVRTRRAQERRAAREAQAQPELVEA